MLASISTTISKHFLSGINSLIAMLGMISNTTAAIINSEYIPIIGSKQITHFTILVSIHGYVGVSLNV